MSLVKIKEFPSFDKIMLMVMSKHLFGRKKSGFFIKALYSVIHSYLCNLLREFFLPLSFTTHKVVAELISIKIINTLVYISYCIF